MSLELDGGACLLELGLDRVGLLLRHTLLNRLRGRVDEVLGLLEAEAGDRADDLDDLDLLAARAGEDDVEGGLLLRLGRLAAGGSAARRDGDRSGGRDAPLLLDLVLQLDQLEDGHAPELLEDGVNCRHLSLPPGSLCSHRCLTPLRCQTPLRRPGSPPLVPSWHVLPAQAPPPPLPAAARCGRRSARRGSATARSRAPPGSRAV